MMLNKKGLVSKIKLKPEAEAKAYINTPNPWPILALMPALRPSAKECFIITSKLGPGEEAPNKHIRQRYNQLSKGIFLSYFTLNRCLIRFIKPFNE